MTPSKRLSAGTLSWRTPAILISLLAYALFCSWDRVRFPFAEDDMMNMAIYFRLGPWRALASQVLLWKGYYRPLGALFYAPLHHWFGLNPAPFQIGVTALLALNVCIFFGFARALGCGRLAAFLAALVVAYHAGLGSLQYNTDQVYDVLCFTFYVGALWYYASLRGRFQPLRGRQIAVFLLLDLAALNAKEMALTMPLVLLAYEACYHGKELSDRKAAWLRGPGLVIVFAGIFNLLALYGRAHGRNAMLANPAYQPVFSLARLVAFQKGSLHDLLGAWGTPGWHGVVAIWLLVTYLAWRRPNPMLRFCWAFMLLTPLPIEFLEDRVQGCLYVPLAGWAIFAAIVFLDLARAAAGFLSGEPLLRRFPRQTVLAALVAAGCFLWAQRMLYLRRVLIEPAAAQQGIATRAVIRDLEALRPRVPSGSRVAFLNDPFTDWDMTFIGQLWFRERSVEVHTQRLEKLPPSELARMDAVFDFQNGRLVQLK